MIFAKKKMMQFFLFSCVTLLLGTVFFSPALKAEGSVRIYPAPAGEPLSTRYAVTVGRQSAPVYIAKVSDIGDFRKKGVFENGEAAFSSFDISGPAEVSVVFQGPVRAAKILPSRLGITPVISGNRITFTVPAPGQLTLEVNGDYLNSLHLFANPFETDAPQPGDPNVIYFGPGIHYIEPTQIGSGKTVYVAGGAVVYGKYEPGPEYAHAETGSVLFLHGSNITLRGRGIIDGSLHPHHGGGIVYAVGSNIKVEGVILRDSAGWTLHVNKSRDVAISNVKVLGWRINSDGTDIDSSQNVEVRDSFYRTCDDLIVLKTNNTNTENHATRNITVKHNVLWNEVAHALELGSELRVNVDSVLFSDNDIIHDKGRDYLLAIFNGDSATANNVAFDNIRIEEARRPLYLYIGSTHWSTDAERGHINNIVFRNIQAPAPEIGPYATFEGADAAHAITGVHLENVTAGGRPVTAADIAKNAYVSDVSIAP